MSLFKFYGLAEIQVQNLQFEEQHESIEFRFCDIVYLKNINFFNCTNQDDQLVYLYLYQEAFLENIKGQDFIGSLYGIIYARTGRKLEIQNFTVENAFVESGTAAIFVFDMINLVIKDSFFYKGQGKMSGFITVTYTDNFSILNTIFDNGNSYFYSGALMAYNVTNVDIQNIVIRESFSYNLGGGFACFGSSNLSILSSVFIKNQSGNQGGSLFLLSVFKSLLQNNVIKDSIANGKGGGLMLSSCSQIYIFDSFLGNNTSLSDDGGALLWLMNEPITQSTQLFLMENITFFKNSAWNGGAMNIQFIYDLDKKNSFIRNCTFSQNFAYKQDGGAVFLLQVSNQLQILDSVFFSNWAAQSGGAIQMISSAVFIKNCIMKNNYADSNRGGAISIADGSFGSILENLEIFWNQAATGAGISIILAQNISINQIKIYENNASSQGGAFNIESSENIKLQNLEIFKNEAGNGAGFFLQQTTNLRIENMKLNQNIAVLSGGGLVIYDGKYISLQNSEVKQNFSQRNYGVLVGSNIYNFEIFNNIFKDNGADINFGGLYLGLVHELSFVNNTVENTFKGSVYIQNGENVSVQNCSFSYNFLNLGSGGGLFISQIIHLQLEKVDFLGNIAQENGGGIAIQQSQQIKIQESKIIWNQVQGNGGGLYLAENRNLEIKNIQLYRNFASQSGGGIYLLNGLFFQIQNLIVKYNNAGDGGGGGIYIAENSDEIEIYEFQIVSNNCGRQGGGIFMQNGGKFKLNNGLFQDNSNILEGKGIFGFNINALEIKNCTMTNIDQKFSQNLCTYGGAIFLKKSDHFQLISTQISNYTALQQGGGVYLNEVDFVEIQFLKLIDNSIQQLIESAFGGGLYIEKGNLLKIQNSQLKDNFAFMKGGGVYIQDFENVVIQNNFMQTNNVFLNQKMNLFKKNEYYYLTQGGSIYIEAENSRYLSIDLKNNTIIEGFASSGGGLFIERAKNQDFYLEFSNNVFQKNVADIGPSLRIIGLQQNKGEFSSLILLVKDQLQLFSSQYSQLIDLKYYKNQDFYGGVIGYVYNEYLENSKSQKFKICPKNTFQRSEGTNNCLNCLEDAICEGGYIPIYPKKEFWRRPSDDFFQFYKCINYQKACLGNDTCAEGHRGLMCQKCDLEKNYAKSGNKCKKCSPNAFWIIFKLIGLMFCIIGLQLYQIYSLRARINRTLFQKVFNFLFDYPISLKSQFSALLKLLILHFQIIYYIIENNLQVNFLQRLNGIAGDPKSLFTNNLLCLLPFKENNAKMEVEIQLLGIAQFFNLSYEYSKM